MTLNFKSEKVSKCRIPRHFQFKQNVKSLFSSDKFLKDYRSWLVAALVAASKKNKSDHFLSDSFVHLKKKTFSQLESLHSINSSAFQIVQTKNKSVRVYY